MTDLLHNGVTIRKRPATIVDVAEMAGVAIGTVSRHLNGEIVRAANRDRIERAIEKLGYQRNSTAMAMKTDTTHIVGFLVPTLDEFHAGMLEHIQREMRRSGRAVLSYFHDGQIDSLRNGLSFFTARRVDALVVNGNDHAKSDLLRLIDRGITVVLYDNDIPGLPVDRVFVDNRKVSERMVRYLLELGHERIAIIHGRLKDSVGQDRMAGYRDALTASGIEYLPDLAVDGQWLESQGYEAMRHLMRLPEPPTAVFGANYCMTFGALSCLREQGVSVPDDISVVSFDDVPAFRLHNPGITTVAQPIMKIAQTISTVIERRMSGSGVPGLSHSVLDSEIILRGSARRLT